MNQIFSQEMVENNSKSFAYRIIPQSQLRYYKEGGEEYEFYCATAGFYAEQNESEKSGFDYNSLNKYDKVLHFFLSKVDAVDAFRDFERKTYNKLTLIECSFSNSIINNGLTTAEYNTLDGRCVERQETVIRLEDYHASDNFVREIDREERLGITQSIDENLAQ